MATKPTNLGDEINEVLQNGKTYKVLEIKEELLKKRIEFDDEEFFKMLEGLLYSKEGKIRLEFKKTKIASGEYVLTIYTITLRKEYLKK